MADGINYLSLVYFMILMPALVFSVLNFGSGAGGREDCPNCRERITNDTEHCPRCGKYRPFDGPVENSWLLALGALICVLSFLFWINAEWGSVPNLTWAPFPT